MERAIVECVSSEFNLWFGFSIHLVCQTGSEQGHISEQLLEATITREEGLRERRWIR